MTITQRGTLTEAVASPGKALKKQNSEEEPQYAYNVCPFYDDWTEVEEQEKLDYEAAQAAKQEAEMAANHSVDPNEMTE